MHGTRSVERTLTLLRELSHRGDFGWRLTDLAEQVGLDRGTCHRLLACFVREGFASRHPGDVKYYPGQRLYELGLGMPAYHAFRERIEPRMERLARATDSVASFLLRSGDEMVCAFQKRGEVELPGMLIRIGSWRPLFSAVAGLAMLQRMPAHASEEILARNRREEIARRGPRRLEALDRMRARSAQAGYGLTRGELAPGIWAMAEAVLDGGGQPLGALTLSGSESTLSEGWLSQAHAQLAETVQDIAADAAQCFRAPG
ncbi:IclR family transcriptional regulator [Pseudorhodoferax soli]|jgi:DNA-binding IclR family transcriptional regulator|uniref:IclR family transcriptional regulator n=1 Tax=Pseudorhodoferax soli TaxID=545864 RepID=A0A368XE79_9BURK|nr:IclR family transcriptional regulator [Pseudorhodoferax soli]RCW64767.1 IclR family transcriptional regulator [Pseudorhodoferax soli]